MEAGRELDALVAEKVMGWEALTNELEIAKREGTPDLVDPQRWHRRKVWFKGSEKMACEECGTLPEYSTNIADAWGVVERLREGNIWFMIKQDNSSGWEAKFWEGLPDGWFPTAEYYAVALMPALAICLAALKAKGVTHE